MRVEYMPTLIDLFSPPLPFFRFPLQLKISIELNSMILKKFGLPLSILLYITINALIRKCSTSSRGSFRKRTLGFASKIDFVHFLSTSLVWYAKPFCLNYFCVLRNYHRQPSLLANIRRMYGKHDPSVSPQAAMWLRSNWLAKTMDSRGRLLSTGSSLNHAQITTKNHPKDIRKTLKRVKWTLLLHFSAFMYRVQPSYDFVRSLRNRFVRVEKWNKSRSLFN